MSRKHLDKEDRLEQHCRRLRTHEPRCVICGETDPRCLEKHHIAGRGCHKDIALACRNCHRKLSDAQIDHAPRGRPSPGPSNLSTIGLYLLGICDFLILVVERLREFGNWLINQSPLTDAAT